MRRSTSFTVRVMSCALLLALVAVPSAGADTLSYSGGQAAYTQTSDTPLYLHMWVEELNPGSPRVDFWDGNADPHGPRYCGSLPTSAECPMFEMPTQVNVALGNGDNVVDPLDTTEPVPLHISTGGGKDIVTLPRNGVANTVIAGSGDDVISAKNGSADTIDCGEGYDTVLVDAPPDPADATSGCEQVVTAAPDIRGPSSTDWPGDYAPSLPPLVSFTFVQGPTYTNLLCWVGHSGFRPCASPYDMTFTNGYDILVVAGSLEVGGQRIDTLASRFTVWVNRPPAPPAVAPATPTPATTAPAIIPASLVLTVARKVRRGRLVVGCGVQGARLKTCDVRLRAGGRSIAEGLADGGHVGLVLSSRAARQLARRGSMAARVTLTATTKDGQHVTLTRSITIRR